MKNRIGLCFLLGVLAGSFLSPADAQTPKPVTIAVATTVLNVGYPMLTLPVTLGYWKKDGFNVAVEPVGASLQAVQQMVAGNVQFAEVNLPAVIQGNVINNLALRVASNNGVSDWAIAVAEDSPIKGPADLKGKTIGVFSLASGGIPLMNSYLKANGISPQSDISMIAVGLGAAPIQALRSKQVDALLYWASALSGFENAGLKLRYLAPADWRRFPDFSLSVMQATTKSDPDMVVAIAKGMAEATVYALANPECAVKLHWQHYPATKPSGADEATLFKWDLNNVKAELTGLADAFQMNGGKWGAIDPAGVGRVQSFLRENGMIASELPAKDLIVDIPNFWTRVADFDADAIRAKAKACQVD